MFPADKSQAVQTERGTTGLHFVVDVEDFGAILQKELKEGGKDLKVTEENKQEFGKPGNYRSKRSGAKCLSGPQWSSRRSSRWWIARSHS